MAGQMPVVVVPGGERQVTVAATGPGLWRPLPKGARMRVGDFSIYFYFSDSDSGEKAAKKREKSPLWTMSTKESMVRCLFFCLGQTRMGRVEERLSALPFT